MKKQLVIATLTLVITAIQMASTIGVAYAAQSI
jgi:hypothetical protein